MTKKVPYFQRISHFYQTVGLPSPTDDRLAVHRREEVMPQFAQKAPGHFRTSFYQLSFVWAAPWVGLPQAGKLVATGPDYLFRGREPDREPFPNGYVLFFSDEFLPGETHPPNALQDFPFFRADTESLAQLPVAEAGIVTDLYEKLLDEFRSDRAGREAILRLYVTTLLHYARRYFCDPTATDPASEKLPVPVINFRRLLNENIQLTRRDNRPFSHSVAHYADELCVHPYYLNRLVKRATSRTASDLIAGYVLTEARYLLTCTSLPIADIAYRLGFGDPSYFIRFFRKKTATTPLQYRLGRLV